MSTIPVPNTYAAWVSVLDMLKSKTDDEAVLDAMLQGSLEWQSGVAERFTQKLVDVINFRMNSAVDGFAIEMGRAHGQERLIVQALLSVRKELRFLAKAIALPVIPENQRGEYLQLVVNQANVIQDALENSAKSERTGKLASIVCNNKVNVF